MLCRHPKPCPRTLRPGTSPLAASVPRARSMPLVGHGMKRAFPNVATVPTVSQRVLFSQVIGSEYEDGWDAAHRLATQKDGIVGSNVGQKVGHGRRDPDNATTRVKVTPTGTLMSASSPAGSTDSGSTEMALTTPAPDWSTRSSSGRKCSRHISEPWLPCRHCFGAFTGLGPIPIT